MTRVEVFCDRCKVRIEADRSILDVACGPLRDRGPFDLCRDCFGALLAWIEESEQRPIDGREKIA